jgi:hypothetical protein
VVTMKVQQLWCTLIQYKAKSIFHQLIYIPHIFKTNCGSCAVVFCFS